MFVVRLMKCLVRLTPLCMVLVIAASAQAQDGRGPHKIIEDATTQMLAAIENAGSYYAEDPQRFYVEVGLILDPIVDFTSFARGVMGYHGSTEAYRELQSKEEKTAFKARITLFSGKFRQTLVQTYSKGLITFSNGRVDVVPADAAAVALIEAGKSVQVRQLIYGDAAEPFEVLYKLAPNKKREWKLRNVVIDNINLGKVYQGQFTSAVRDAGGDVDAAIANWSLSADPAEA
ncbi:MAG: ABC transporter substrate-binding protein [Pseudomonadales bacterium]